MTNDPRTFGWEYDEPRKSVDPVGPDGFLQVSDQDPPQVMIEATLRFEGTELKGYTGVFEVQDQYAEAEVFLGDCVVPTVQVNPNLAEKIVLRSQDAGFVEAPDNGTTNFTTSLELIIKWAPNDWGDLRQVFASAHDGGFETGYRWQMGVFPSSNFFWWSGGSLFGSTVLGSEDPDKDWVPIVSNGVVIYQRLTFDVSGGNTTINHYERRLATDPWTLVFSDVRGTEEPIDPTSSHPMRVGGDSAPASGYMDGDLYFIQFFDADGGTLKSEVQASSFQIGDGAGDTAADFAGRVWTLNGAGISVV